MFELFSLRTALSFLHAAPSSIPSLLFSFSVSYSSPITGTVILIFVYLELNLNQTAAGLNILYFCRPELDFFELKEAALPLVCALE